MPKCGLKTETYSRVVGYYRPVSLWNKGKQAEWKDRKTYDVALAAAKIKGTTFTSPVQERKEA